MNLLAVKASELLEVVWVSLAAGIGLTTAYSLVVLGAGKSARARRTGRHSAAVGYGAMAAVFLVLAAAGIVIGVHVMLRKS